jgi:rubrerythrin
MQCDQIKKEKIMSFDTFEEIINFAIEREKETVAFYEEASSLEPYAWAKETFEGFAKEEQKHQALLEGFLKGEKVVADYKFQWVTDIKRSDYLVDLTYEKGMSYPDALRLAMKREEKALALYNELQKNADGEELVKVFKMLSQEEAKHKLALETLYDDYMAEQGD